MSLLTAASIRLVGALALHVVLFASAELSILAVAHLGCQRADQLVSRATVAGPASERHRAEMLFGFFPKISTTVENAVEKRDWAGA